MYMGIMVTDMLNDVTRSMYMGIMVTDMLNDVKMHTESSHGYSIRMPKSTQVFRLQHVNRDNRPDSVPNFGLTQSNISFTPFLPFGVRLACAVASDSGLDVHRIQKTRRFGAKIQLIVLGNDSGVHGANPDWVEPLE